MPLGFVGSRGCSWARAGGCTMCDYGGFLGEIPDALLVQQTSGLLDQWPHETEINLSCLGSFFDDRELSDNARTGILREIASRPQIELLGVESRADDITVKKIREARELLGPRRCLEVGIGLESVDEFVRNVCVNKGLSLDTFEQAIRILHSNGAHAVGHVLLKPPFLTESEAIADAVATIDYLNSLSVRRIVLMVTNVKQGTIVGKLYRLGCYRPPWLWSVLRVALSVSPPARDRLLIYGFRCGLPMEAIASNCFRCSEHITQEIEEFCGTGESFRLRMAFALDCPCKSAWCQALAERQPVTLRERVTATLDLMSGSIDDYAASDRCASAPSRQSEPIHGE